jgi:hypothetical protein
VPHIIKTIKPRKINCEGECNMRGLEVKSIQNSGRGTRRKDHLEDLVVDVMIILKNKLKNSIMRK